MKAVKIVGQEKIEVVETPVPEVGPNDALVRLKATALCRSDLYRYHGTTCFDDDSANTNFTPGHEPCGIVEKVGDKVTNVKPGDRVGLFMFVGCGECEYCLRGDEMLCKQFGCIGFQRDGAHADYIVLPGANCLKIPDEMSFVAASLLTDVGGPQHHPDASPQHGDIGPGPIAQRDGLLGHPWYPSVIRRKPSRFPENTPKISGSAHNKASHISHPHP